MNAPIKAALSRLADELPDDQLVSLLRFAETMQAQQQAGRDITEREFLVEWFEWLGCAEDAEARADAALAMGPPNLREKLD